MSLDVMTKQIVVVVAVVIVIVMTKICQPRRHSGSHPRYSITLTFFTFIVNDYIIIVIV